MKKIVVVLLIITFIVTIGFTIMSDEKTDNFDFSLRYSVDGNDFVSTFDHTLKVDTVAGIKITDFEFTEKDLERIKSKIIELGITETDFSEMPNSGLIIFPMGIYTLDLKYDGQTKSIYWTTQNASPILSESIKNKKTRYDGEYGRVYRLFDLKDFIVEIIKEYDEYKELPAHRMYQ
jgi:hypothetical protein